MTAHRALPFLPRRGDSSATWLALSFGTPAGVALGFFGGWVLGSVLLGPVRATSIETVTA